MHHQGQIYSAFLPMLFELPRSVTSNGRLLCKQCGQFMVEVKVLDGSVYSSFSIPSSLRLSTIHTQTHNLKHDKAIGLNGTCEDFYKLATI